MIELRALFGEGLNQEAISGEPEYVLSEILRSEGDIEELYFTFKDGELKLTRDGDVLGEKSDFDPTTFRIDGIYVNDKKFKDINKAIDFARGKKECDIEVKFDFRANSPQDRHYGIEIVINEKNHTTFMKEYD